MEAITYNQRHIEQSTKWNVTSFFNDSVHFSTFKPFSMTDVSFSESIDRLKVIYSAFFNLQLV